MIIKKNISSSKNVDKKDDVSACGAASEVENDEKKVVKKVTSNSKYDTCLRYIRSAIDCLSDSTDVDAEDKETIANLGVVALDVANKKKACCTEQ